MALDISPARGWRFAPGSRRRCAATPDGTPASACDSGEASVAGPRDRDRPPRPGGRLRRGPGGCEERPRRQCSQACPDSMKRSPTGSRQCALRSAASPHSRILLPRSISPATLSKGFGIRWSSFPAAGPDAVRRQSLRQLQRRARTRLIECRCRSRCFARAVTPGDYSDTVRPATNPSPAAISSTTSCGTGASVVTAITARPSSPGWFSS